MEKLKTRTHKVWTLIGLLLILALLPLLTVNITLIVKSYIEPDLVPDFLGYKPFIVMTGSMEPAISAGDLIITEQPEAGSLKAGDIIAYRHGDMVVTHRIQSLSSVDGQPGFVMKGDANNMEDTLHVTEDMVEGRLWKLFPGMGAAAMFLKTPLGMLTAAGVPLLLALLFEVIQRRRAHQYEKARVSILEAELKRIKEQTAN